MALYIVFSKLRSAKKVMKLFNAFVEQLDEKQVENNFLLEGKLVLVECVFFPRVTQVVGKTFEVELFTT